MVTGKILTDWTKGTITVVPKGGDLTDPGNWRPITQTSIFAKFLEELVHTRLLKYFLTNNIISEYQFVFLPGRSTQLAVFELTKQIYSSMNNKKIFEAVCLNLSKAFDCINHVKLYNKMRSCGIIENVLRWFRNYFNRTQEVRICHQVSMCKPIRTGIDQETILGPLIFIFYINDVIRNIADLRINMYADDCLIYTIGNNWDRRVVKIQSGLSSFQEWCVNNGMKLNIKNTKSLVIGSTFKLADINLDNRFTLNGVVLERVQSYNYLGVILDTHMTLSALIKKVKKVVSNKIYTLAKIRNSISLKCALTIYEQTILPLLDYTGFMLLSANISDKNDLQVMQNNALRICFNVRLRDRVSIDQMHS